MQTIIPEKPHDLLAIDHVGPLPTSKYNMKYILTALDTLSKHIFLYPVKDITASSTIIALKKHFNLFGCPERIQMDNAKCFIPEKKIQFLTKLDMETVFSSVDRPQGNIVERPHKKLNCILRTYIMKEHTESLRFQFF